MYSQQENYVHHQSFLHSAHNFPDYCHGLLTLNMKSTMPLTQPLLQLVRVTGQLSLVTSNQPVQGIRSVIFHKPNTVKEMQEIINIKKHKTN